MIRRRQRSHRTDSARIFLIHDQPGVSGVGSASCSDLLVMESREPVRAPSSRPLIALIRAGDEIMRQESAQDLRGSTPPLHEKPSLGDIAQTKSTPAKHCDRGHMDVKRLAVDVKRTRPLLVHTAKLFRSGLFSDTEPRVKADVGKLQRIVRYFCSLAHSPS